MHRFSRSVSIVACFSLLAFCAAYSPAARGASQNAALFAPLRVLAGFLGLTAPVLPQKPQKNIAAKPQTRPIRLAAAPPTGIGPRVQTFTVNDTGDSGDATTTDGVCDIDPTSGGCTLRAAIEQANATPGADIIQFAIFGTPGGEQTIAPTSPLPIITEQVTINGYTQDGASANTSTGTVLNTSLKIVLDGTSAGTGADGLTISSASNCVIKGLNIRNFDDAGVIIDGSSASGNTVEGCFIGTTSGGTSALANKTGIAVTGSALNNTIGGTTAASHNVVSGNIGNGITTDNGCNNNTLRGNYIGINAAGTTAVANGGHGVRLSSIGNTVSDNVISGNTGTGLRVLGDGAAGTATIIIQGNIIGLNATAAAKVPNDNGLFINNRDNVTVGGLSTALRNTISGNTREGILVSNFSTGNSVTIQGNRIGSNANGDTNLGNGDDGIFIVGGTGDQILSNPIVGNGGNGIEVATSTGVVIQQNNLGVPGNGNTLAGVSLVTAAQNTVIGGAFNDSTPGGEGNLIAGNRTGVSVFSGSNDAVGNTIRGNTIQDNTELGINLDGDGTSGDDVTANDDDLSGATDDDDTGNNNLQNFPNITSLAGNNIIGNFHSTPGKSFVLDFYRNVTPDSSGFGEGETLVTSQPVTTDANGDANFSFAAGAAIGSDTITATATRTSATDATGTRGDTSEFSAAVGAVQSFTVNSSADTNDGACNATNCTLREAINAANSSSGADIIQFAISGTPGVAQTISPTSPLPIISEAVTIDGSMQPGFSATPLIVLSGQNSGVRPPTSFAAALQITADNCIVRSLCFNNGFPGGIEISGVSGNALASNNKVEGCFFGTNAAGTAASTLSGPGISLSDGGAAGNGATNNIIGGTTAAQRNIINTNKPNSGFGIDIEGDNTSGNRVIGNFIGTNAAGTGAIGSAHGIGISAGAHDNLIGGTTAAERNIISGNDTGVLIYSNANTIQGNYIGTDVTGNAALANTNEGVSLDAGAAGNIIGGTATTPGSGRGNVISGNGGPGVEIIGRSFGTGAFSANNIVQGNLIGLKANGGALANAFGVAVTLGANGNRIGGTTAGQGNVISGNTSDGIHFSDAGTNNNTVQGNFIGTNTAGTGPLGNANGVFLGFDSQTNTIGGTTPAARNIISGNNGDGVQFPNGSAVNNLVQGNFIGLNAAGTAAIANTGAGVTIGNGSNTIGGAVAGAGNVISGNTGHGVQFNNSGASNTIAGNFIGTNAAGTADIGNGGDGVSLRGGGGSNVIGGTTAAARNVISGNDGNGVGVTFPSNTILGNFIGTNAAGTAALGNTLAGVRLQGSSGNIIGGGTASARNIISGNTEDGVRLTLNGITNTRNARIEGNFIGTDVNGTGDLGNGRHGINADGAVITDIGSDLRNVISGNAQSGIAISGDSRGTYAGNFIGVDASGNVALPNSVGIFVQTTSSQQIIGAAGAAGRNVISGNTNTGVLVRGANSNATIVNNLIGLGADGTTDVGNTLSGVLLDGGASGNAVGGGTGLGNVISGNGGGVRIEGAGTNNRVQGNIIGLAQDGATIRRNDAAGINVIGTASTDIGGISAPLRNIISGNGAGIVLDAGTTATFLLSNFIGTDITGALDRGNDADGISISNSSNNTIGDAVAGTNNVISGNGGPGVHIFTFGGGTATGNKIYAARIGTGAAGASVQIPNTGEGVLIDSGAANNRVGDGSNSLANIIAFNNSAGVRVPTGAGTGNQITRNAIFSNAGLGIDLGANGITGNDLGDGDSGANNLQNFPTITSVTPSGTNVFINGTLDSAPGSYTIEVFRNTSADPLGNGEGEIFAGSATSTVPTAGLGTFSLQVPGTVSDSYTATATRAAAPFDTSEFSVAVSGAQTFTVNSAADTDDGTCTAAVNGCTLREAINATNANTGADTISFEIPGAVGAVRTITPATALPIISEAVTINGYSQSGSSANTLAVGNNAVLLIQISGNGVNGDGLRFNGGNSLVRGLIINGFTTPDAAAILFSSSNNTVSGCFLGTNAAGTAVAGNEKGVRIGGFGLPISDDNTVGGASAGARNVISGNTDEGVLIVFGPERNTVQNNYIGTDKNGTAAVANGEGVVLAISPNHRVLGNVISGNQGSGMRIDTDGLNPSDASGHVIRGNFIGTNARGTAAIPNATGIFMSSGINNTIGGLLAGEANVISGNTGDGVAMQGSNTNTIQGNIIGLNAAGTAKVANGGNGLNLTLNSVNTIGGASAAARNVISGNGAAGLRIDRGSEFVRGNFIGTNAAGTAALGNTGVGVLIVEGAGNIIGGEAAGERNVISGNGASGIVVGGTGFNGNSIFGNFIGTNAAGTAGLANAIGITVQESTRNNGIGLVTNFFSGAVTGRANLIAFNTGDGVRLQDTATGNTVRGNAIHSNGRLGINLVGGIGELGNGVTPNDTDDADTGPNNYQNSPVLSNVRQSGGNTLVDVSLNSVGGSNYLLDFYTNATADPSGNGEGQTFVGTDKLTIPGGATTASKTVTLTGNLTSSFLTATATLEFGNDTSEFSVAVSGAQTFTINSTADTDDGACTAAVNGCTLREAINATNANAGADTISFALSGTGVQTIRPSTPLPAITDQVTLDGYSQPLATANTLVNGFDANILIALSGENIVGGASGLVVQANNSLINGLIIHRFQSTALVFNGNNNRLEGCMIGPDSAGTGNFSNASNGEGVRVSGTGNIIGGAFAGRRNIISGNRLDGISISGAAVAGNNRVEGNFIGTTKTGLAPLGNGRTGVSISGLTNNTIGGGATAFRNIISGNQSGIVIFTASNLVQSNYIGVGVNGTTAIGNRGRGVFVQTGSNNFIGGAAPGKGQPRGNVISNNSAEGVATNGANSTRIQGNIIGLNAPGTALAPNGTAGISLLSNNNSIGGANPVQGNIISGNGTVTVPADGLRIDGNNNTVLRNLIGIGVNGSTPRGNTGHGIFVNTCNNNVIGSSTASNSIAHNGKDGVRVTEFGGNGVGNALLINQIFNNGGLAINLVGGAGENAAGVTPNDQTTAPFDSDTGPNNLQNFPVLTAAPGGTRIQGTLTSTQNTLFTLSFYDNATADPSGFGEGQRFLKLENVTTDASGVAIFDFPIAPALPVGRLVTATATSITTNNTSEFSKAVRATQTFTVNTTDADDDGACDILSSTTDCTLREAINAANAAAGVNTINFAISGTGVKTIAPTSALPTITGPTLIDGASQPGFVPGNAPLIRLDGSGVGQDVVGLTITAANCAVRMLNIADFAASGIRLTGTGATGNRIEGCYIGTNAAGTAANPNGVNVSAGEPAGKGGVLIDTNARNNDIGNGGSGNATLRNVISGNIGRGIEINNFAAANTKDNVVAGNYIGLKADGLSALPNGGAGVELAFQTSGNKIGLAGANNGNVISGHNLVPASGVSIGQGCFNNIVVNNFIGTNKNGTGAVPNQNGISIAFNAHDNIIGGTTAAQRNVISGNAQAGIAFGDGANNNRVFGNFIGTKNDGTTDLGNGGGGGISIGAGGPALTGAFNNIIGGTAAGQANVIAFNGGDGVTIIGDGATVATGNSIRRNSIFSNGQLGIDLIGGLENNQVTKNDSGDGDNGANRLQNYPELTSAVNEVAGTRVSGTLNGPANTLFNIEFFDNVTPDSSSFGQGERFVSALNNFDTGSTGTGTFNVVIPSVPDGHFISATATSIGGDTSEFSKVLEVGAVSNLPELSINNVRVTEGSGANAIFTVTLSQASLTAVTVNFTTANGTAIAPGDYTAKTGTLNFSAGELTKTISVAVANDAAVEPDETFKVNLSAPSGATIADATGLGTIDDEATPNFVVDTNSDANLTACTAAAGDCSLRGAINNANADAAPQTIAFAIPGSGVPTIILTSPLPAITQPLTIDGFSQNPATGGPQVEINGNGRNYGVTLQGANSAVKGLIINLCNLAGVRITGSAAQNNNVQGCYIGTNITGTSLLPNQDGVEISAGAKNNVLGGTGTARNLISGNFGRGVFITGAGTTGNQLTGNFIGTRRDGLSALSNGTGVEISGGAGSNAIGGTGARNFISGNDRGGVFINGANDNKVQGNYIGVNVNGAAALPNSGSGVEISGGAKNNLVGGGASATRNVIAGNTGRGVLISGLGSDGNKVQGNYIGTNATGAAALANASDGLAVASGAKNNVIGGATSGSGNLLSGNRLSGISLEGDTTASNTVIGNRIGVAANGTASLPNNQHGVSIAGADNNVIGGTGTSSNLIANNKADGVAVTTAGGPATGNRIRGNRIFNNTGLGIDLADNGVTLNDAADADNGPNGLQNFPTITDAGQFGANQPLQLSGTFASAPGRDFIIDVYAGAAQDPTLFGEGEKYIGTFNLTTDAGGAANFARSVGDTTLADLSNQFITLTATDSLSGNSSEFSKAFKVPATSGLVITPPGVTPPTPITLLPCEQQQFSASVAGVPVAVRWTASGGTITPSNAGTVPVATIDYKAGSASSFTLTATPPSGAPVSVTINVSASPDNFFGWGFNAYGNVGDNTTSQQNAPVDVSLPPLPTIIAAGGSHSLAVSDGKLFAWGLNQDFQLGLGDQSNRTVPTQVPGVDGTKVTALACGFYHSLAVVNGEVFAWGYNRYGQSGQPPGTGDPHVLVPTRVPNLSNVVEVSAGVYFSLARTSNGDVFAWGSNLYGQCGPAASGTVQVTPVKVTLSGSASAIGAGAAHSAALVGGQVFAWGLNETGQLGNGTSGVGLQTARPVRAGTLSGMTLLAVGYAHTLAGNATTVFSWGNNGKSELGRNGTTNSATPGAISGLSGVTKLAAGSAHNLAVRSDGSLWSWGSNDFGNLGLGDTANRATPQQVTQLRGVRDIAAGYAHSFAVAKEDLCASPAGPPDALRASVQDNETEKSVEKPFSDSGSAFSSSDSIVLALAPSDKAPTFFRVAVNGRDVEVQSVQKSQDATTLLLPTGTLKAGDQIVVTWNSLGGLQSLTLQAE